MAILFYLQKDSIFYSAPPRCKSPKRDSSTDFFTSFKEASQCNGLRPRKPSIDDALSLKEDEYTEMKNIVVYCATWNVAGRSPLGFVREWLAPEPIETLPDIYAIGFQEVNYLENISEWEENAKAALNTLFPHTYKKKKCHNMHGIVLVIFARKHLLHQITEVDASYVATGVLNTMKNKGAVAIRFNLYKTSFCFVSCHLAHGKTSYERRNQDFHEICYRMSLKQNLLIEDHERIIWFGDLNYRVQTILPQESLKALLDSDRGGELLAKDQLMDQQKEGKAFVGYNKGAITFDPTYKYNVGTSEYDTGNHRRPPAWTDRILWKGDSINQICYQSHPNLKISDHKPVSAIFHIGVESTNEQKKHKILNDLFDNYNSLDYRSK